MKNETYYFVSHLLQENHPISKFVDAPYSFLNGALARHYGVNGVAGRTLERFSFPQKLVGEDYWGTPVC